MLLALLNWKKLGKKIKITILVMALCAITLMLWSFWYEPSQLIVTETSIALDNWHGEHNNLKVAILTDLHVGSPYITLEKLNTIVARTNEQQPDIVVILGDLLIGGVKGGSFVEPEPIAEGLKALQAKLGVYAVLGNHDWNYDGQRVTQALHEVGIKVLENNAARIEYQSKGFWIGGIGDQWTRHSDIDGTLKRIKNDDPIIFITHNPDIFPKVPSRVSITLAGHTHGGQVCLPLLGRPVVPSQFGQRYAIGHVIEDNRSLFVSSGIGTSIIPVRFRVTPEITILNLSKK
jgi:uncharacterized protein